MRLIDIDPILAWANGPEVYEPYGVRGSELMRKLLDAPTIEAVSIVRCKECKHKYQEPWNNGVAVEGECEIWHNATLDNDFCSYGERKTND